MADFGGSAPGHSRFPALPGQRRQGTAARLTLCAIGVSLHWILDHVASGTMSNPAKMIELPEAFQAFAEERVRSGQAASVEEVALEAFREKQLAAIYAEVDAGLAEIEAGDCIEIDDPKEMLQAMRDGISFDEMRARLEAKKAQAS